MSCWSQENRVGFGSVLCRGIASPAGRSGARFGSAGWSSGADSAYRTETGRKWADCRTRRPLDTAGPGCKYLQWWERRKLTLIPPLNKENNSLMLQACETDHMLMGPRCVPPWNSQSLTGLLRLMGFPWRCTQLVGRKPKRTIVGGCWIIV